MPTVMPMMIARTVAVVTSVSVDVIALRQQRVDRLVLDADAEVAAEEAAEPEEVAQRGRDVEVEQLGASLDELCLVGCVALPQLLEGVARRRR